MSVEPKYDILYENLIGTTSQANDYQGAFSFGSLLGGTGTFEEWGFTFSFSSVEVLTSIGIVLTKLNNPIDGVACALHLDSSGTPGTLIATSPDIYTGSSNPDNLFPFRFLSLPLEAGTTYFVRVYRTGIRDIGNFWRTRVTTSGSNGYVKDNGSWSSPGGWAIGYRINVYRTQVRRDIDMSERMEKFTIDTGKSDIDGRYKEGKVDLDLMNDDDLFSPADDENNNIKLGRKMQFQMIENFLLLDGCELPDWNNSSNAPAVVVNSVNKVEGDYSLDLGKDTGEQELMVDTCDSITGWTYSSAALAPTLDTSTKQEGTASIKVGKDGTNVLFDYQHPSIGPFDFITEDNEYYAWFWIKDSATLNKLNDATYGIELRAYSGVSDWFYIRYKRSALTTGWNKVGAVLSSFSENGSPDETAINKIEASFQSNNAGDLITSGDILTDWYHVVLKGTGALYNKTLASSFDGTGLEFNMHFRIDNVLDFEDSGTAIKLYIGTDDANFYYKEYTRANLLTGYNIFSELISGLSSTGSPDIETLQYLGIEIFTPEITDTIASGDIGIDYIFAGIVHYLFTGNIARMKPGFAIGKKQLAIVIEDLFKTMREMKVSFSWTSYTVKELVEGILNQIPLNPNQYNVSNDDTTILRDAGPWEDVAPKSKLDKCVEVGQHHQFMDGEGIYQFKSNQWLNSPDPDFTFDTLSDMDGYSFEYDVKGVKNHIRVEYPTDNWVEDEDTESIINFSRRTQEIENELMPSQSYAESVRDYLLAMKSGELHSIEVTLNNRFDSIYGMELGKILDVVNPFTDDNDLYSVQRIIRKITKEVRHSLQLSCKNWISPAPMFAFYDLRPFDSRSLVGIISGQTEYANSQGFLVPTTGDIRHVKIKFKHNVIANYNFTMEIFAVDGNGLPTGSVLATSETLRKGGPGYGGGLKTFTFLGAQQITLTGGTTYVWALRRTNDSQQNITFQGKAVDEYFNGVAAWKNNGGTWAVIANQDRYFEVRIETGP